MEWLEARTTPLAELAADERVKSIDFGPVEQVPPPAALANDVENLVVLQEKLGGSFSLISGEVVLENGSAKQAELPRAMFYSGTGSLEVGSLRQIHAACGVAAEDTVCERRSLPDGREYFVWSVAKADRAKALVIGEVGLSLALSGERFALARVEVKGRELNRAGEPMELAKVRTWLESLQEELLAAVSDPRVDPGE
ncbi:MAG: hypothetical protein ACT4QF_23545 [Sporichthyaceae bacterium]